MNKHIDLYFRYLRARRDYMKIAHMVPKNQPNQDVIDYMIMKPKYIWSSKHDLVTERILFDTWTESVAGKGNEISDV